MWEVRVHGRRGQGVLAAAELLAIASSLEGRRAQALPGFGVDRAVGEVVAFCRIGAEEPVARPGALIVVDDGLPDRSADLDDDGYLLVNSTQRTPPRMLRPERTITVPATDIARKWTGRPVPDAALLGAFAALSGTVSLDSVLTAVRQWFPGPAGKAQSAATLATFSVVRTRLEDLTEPAAAL